MEEEFTLTMPLDSDGYATFECPCCLDSFQMRGEEYNADDLFEFWCPSCGLKSDSYVPRSVIELAKAKVLNRFLGKMENELRQISSSTRGSILSIEVKTNFGKEHENLLFPDVAAFEEVICRICERPYRVHPLTLFTGPYCPFCGESI